MCRKYPRTLSSGRDSIGKLIFREVPQLPGILLKKLYSGEFCLLVFLMTTIEIRTRVRYLDHPVNPEERDYGPTDKETFDATPRAIQKTGLLYSLRGRTHACRVYSHDGQAFQENSGRHTG